MEKKRRVSFCISTVHLNSKGRGKTDYRYNWRGASQPSYCNYCDAVLKTGHGMQPKHHMQERHTSNRVLCSKHDNNYVHDKHEQ